MAADKDLVSVQQARDLVEAAHRAQGQLARFDQAKIDRVCEAMARAALRESARLGALAVEETGYGIADDKREKNRFAAEDVWNFFRSLRTVGVINESKAVLEIASPRGVVAGIIPSTNPTSTAIFKILIATKSRNTIVLSPHPSAAKGIGETARVMREAGVKEGLPAEAIACMTSATIEGTESLMKHKQTAVILATGGIGLVRAAYSSGKPAFGVGPGNVPVFVERSADVPLAVQNILTSKCFDNGTICASEQAVVADAPVAAQVKQELEAQGAHFLSASEADQLAKVVATPQRALNPAVVGKSVEVVAKMAGLSVPPDTRCLVAEVGGVGREHPLSMEKGPGRSRRPAVSGRGDGATRGLGEQVSPSPRLPVAPSHAAGGGVSRDDIAKIVDRFLSGRQPGSPAPQTGAQPMPVAHPHSVVQAGVDLEPQRLPHSGGAAPHPEAAPTPPNAGG